MKPIRLIVAGSRIFKEEFDKRHIFYHLNRLTKDWDYENVELVCGKAKGPDTFGEEWAKSKSIIIKPFFPEWQLHGKKAGMIRNTQMGNYATHLVAFFDGQSKGTQHMIQYAEKKGLKTRVIDLDISLEERIKLFRLDDSPKECKCDHNIRDTGGIFMYSFGVIKCNHCQGWQLIRKKGLV